MGLFHEEFSPEPGREELVPKMTVILQTARDIARGLDHIHKHNILHGDLTAGNILLTWSSPGDTSNQNFTAKVVHCPCVEWFGDWHWGQSSSHPPPPSWAPERI